MIPIVYAYKNLPEADKVFLEKYLEGKVDRLSTLAKGFDGAACRLEVHAEKFATKSAYKIGMKFYLSGYQLLAEEDDHTVIEATDLALDKLIIQLRKLVDKKNHK
jgi:ribosome-associated translation inhibitor RaiA